MKLSPVLFSLVWLCLALTAAASTNSAVAADTASGAATSAAKLEIQRAIYGADGGGSADVKTKLMALIQSGQNSIVANNDLVGYDPASGQIKQLHIEYMLDGKPGTVTVDEGKTFTYSANASPPFVISLPVRRSLNTILAENHDAVAVAADTASGAATSAAKLEIQRAVYGADGFGSEDVKTILMALIQSGRKSIVANNDLVGYDPASGQGKQLHIDYTLDGKPGTVTVGEGKTFTYSANANPPFVISLPAMKPPNTILAENHDAVAVAADTASGAATSAAKLEIQRAIYGAGGGDSADVKTKLMSLIQSGRKSIVANNDLVGYDPASGQGKQLHIEYTLDGKPGTVTVDEGNTLTYSANASPPFGIRSAKNPLNTIVAENYDAVAGEIKTEVCSEGGYDLCSIHDGNYVVYKDYDFDSGVAAFKARVASTNHGLIEVRLDGPAGPLIGSCPFDGTGGWQDWRDVTCNVDNSQAKVRNICLVFRGDTRSALVNLSWFVFLKSGGG